MDPHKEGNFDGGDLGGSPEEMAELQRKYKEFQRREAQTNHKLRDRMLALAKEAQDMGAI